MAPYIEVVEMEAYIVFVVESCFAVDYEMETFEEDFDKEMEAYMYLNDLKNYFEKENDFVELEEENIDFVEVEVDLLDVVGKMYLNVEYFVENYFVVVVKNHYFDMDFEVYMYLIY